MNEVSVNYETTSCSNIYVCNWSPGRNGGENNAEEIFEDVCNTEIQF